MDFETAVRERIPILSILPKNFCMAIELEVMPVSTEKYRSTGISGDYATFARSMGGYGERIVAPGDIVPAIVPPMSNEITSRLPARRPNRAVASPPPAGPDSSSRMGTADAVAGVTSPPAECIRRNVPVNRRDASARSRRAM